MTMEELQAQLARTEAMVRTLQDELSETNRGLVAMTLDLEQRVDARTAELRQLNLELEARVQERTAQLREANDNLQNFAHTAAHDLRSPLRAIQSFSVIVLEEHGPQLGAEGQSLLQRVTQSASQIQHLLDDLLEYSKISQGELKLETVSLQKAVCDALTLLESDIRAKNAIVTVADSLPEIIGHPATVVLLINNFVSNALKFIPPGVPPQIRIWAEIVQSSESNAPESTPASSAIGNQKSETRNARVRLRVQDNGIGIAPKDLGKLFGVFQRLHGKGAYPGTGLGLAIVRKGAERMGGSVGVESEPGKGSCFWVELVSASDVKA